MTHSVRFNDVCILIDTCVFRWKLTRPTVALTRAFWRSDERFIEITFWCCARSQNAFYECVLTRRNGQQMLAQTHLIKQKYEHFKGAQDQLGSNLGSLGRESRAYDLTRNVKWIETSHRKAKNLLHTSMAQTLKANFPRSTTTTTTSQPPSTWSNKSLCKKVWNAPKRGARQPKV